MEALDNTWSGSWRPLINLTYKFQACHLCTFNVAAIFFRVIPTYCVLFSEYLHTQLNSQEHMYCTPIQRKWRWHIVHLLSGYWSIFCYFITFGNMLIDHCLYMKWSLSAFIGYLFLMCVYSYQVTAALLTCSPLYFSLSSFPSCSSPRDSTASMMAAQVAGG